jgi:peptide/nickel transport system substrate-binding protein
VVKLEYRTSNNIISKIAFDTTNEPFKDQRLRHAFLYGIPYDSVIKLFAGYATRTGPLPPGNQMWALPVEDLPATDMERAKALLSEAGYGPDNMLKVKSVVSLYGGPQFSQIVQSLVKPLGIEITIETMESGEWVSKIYSGKQPYHLTAHFDATFDDPDRRLYSYYHSKGAQNQTHYSNPEVDRLLEAQRREFDAEKRRDLVRQVQRLIVNDAPEVFVVSNGGRLLRRTWVNNWHLMLYYLNTDRQLDSIWYDPMPSGRAG